MTASIVKSPPPARRITTGFTDPAFARIAALAHLLAGLVFPPNRQPSAEAGMRRAMSVLRIGQPAALLRAFETPGDARDAVLAELTVGESYFFRDAAQLDLLATDVLPARLASYGAKRPLRLWSAGCASGEEPHTLAIMLREQRWPHPALILGTDIARPRLDAARRGRYTRWALRGVSDERIARWFSRSGTFYDLEPEVRDAAQFRLLNLVVDDYALPEQGVEGFDVVLCRNVMIYFDMPTVAAIATRLLASLAPDGWLILGASDPPLVHVVPCEAVLTPAGIAYRRADRPGAATTLRATTVRVTPSPGEFATTGDVSPPTPTPWPPAWPAASNALAAPTFADAPEKTAVDSATILPAAELPATDAALAPTALAGILRAYALADYPAAEQLAVAALGTPATNAEDLRVWIVYVRSVANQGRLHEAGGLCARALELHPLDAELHYLHATLLAEAGWHADAAAAARRAIYLDRQFVMGHLLLGDALSRTGDSAGARNAFANAAHLLEAMDASAMVTASDGVPAARLRQVAALRLRALSGTSP
ncbi:MAG: protein-glutamate O-methyltransferase CheR [bacterium]